MFRWFRKKNAIHCPNHLRHHRQTWTQKIHKPFLTSRRLLYTLSAKMLRFVHPKRTPMEKWYMEDVLSKPHQHRHRPKWNYQLWIRIGNFSKLAIKLIHIINLNLIHTCTCTRTVPYNYRYLKLTAALAHFWRSCPRNYYRYLKLTAAPAHFWWRYPKITIIKNEPIYRAINNSAQNRLPIVPKTNNHAVYFTPIVTSLQTEHPRMFCL